MDKITKYGWWVLIITPLVFTFGVYLNNGYRANGLICPDDFKNTDEENANFKSWVSNYVDKNSATSSFEVYQARRNFYKENNCLEILKAIEEQEILNQKNAELRDAGKYEEAIALNKEYIKDHPYDLDPWVNKTIAYAFLGDCVNALASAYHVDMNNYSFPEDNPDKLRNNEDLFPYITNSDICKKIDTP